MARLTKTQIDYLKQRFGAIVRRVEGRFDKLNPPKTLLTRAEKVGLIHLKKADLDIDQFEGDGCHYGGYVTDYFTYKGECEKEAYNATMQDHKAKLLARLIAKREAFIDRFVLGEYTDAKAIELFEKECIKSVEKVSKKPITKRGKK